MYFTVQYLLLEMALDPGTSTNQTLEVASFVEVSGSRVTPKQMGVCRDGQKY